MRKLSLSIAALLFAASGPAMAQSDENREHSAMQHIGGHYRHMHRDWSGQEGRHTHSVCWNWDPGHGWVWSCNR
ncbi:hypothetical protein LMG27198_41190 [Methylocystis echinoides]|uniref:Uncharacterized protein n=1 Tax=Methylocystis echinoides TaxID=29468 RepID=A0A9W6GXT7_9HYPH|nr:MAG: hypothetical protein EKK29_10795 [Hyphomicrobiales bacterium]GLI95127.1 hypothetical protein LMG27198_41190 [Methylocystis echinoides]